jgi:hypothetical protein
VFLLGLGCMDERPWPKIWHEIHRLANLIGEHAHLIDRAEGRIDRLEERVDRIEHDD